MLKKILKHFSMYQGLTKQVYFITMFCFMFGLPQIANAASFDCKKANTWVEKTICSNSELSKLDEKMAKQYRDEAAQLNSSEDYLKLEQRQWLKYQRNTCKTKQCLLREYKEKINGEFVYGATGDYPLNLKKSNVLINKVYGEFTKNVNISVYNPSAKNEQDVFEDENTLVIHEIPSKPYLSIIEGSFVFTNAHMCSLNNEKAEWSENHWVFNDFAPDQTCELRVYPNNNTVLLRDVDNQCRKSYCGMRGYFDGMVLEKNK